MGNRSIRVAATVAVAASLSGTSGARPPAAAHDAPVGRAEATGDGQPDAPSATEAGSSDESAYGRAAEALTRINYPWQTRLEGWSVMFLPARPGYLGATWREPKRIEIYVREDQSVGELAFTIAHELGHAVDITYLDADDRSAWLAARGAGDTQWWTTSGASDYAVGAGDWAEAFAVWQVGGTSMSTLGGQPTPAQLELLAEQASG